MKRTGTALSLLTAAAYLIFLTGFLVLVILGVGLFRRVTDGQSANNDRRAMLSYIASAVRSADAEGCLYVEAGPDGPVFVIADREGVWGSRLYLEEDCLMEVYGRLSDPLTASEGSPIGTTTVFSVEEEKPGFFRITTDEGCVLTGVRSEYY